ncbi:alpha/beta fold hydrolase [Poritiphilus flavus]|uniref:Alpha/beta fold hydrolase n=1 Tax=Poritiphilus flavus TaxID=2697053 RepID=A0A6L9EBV8_9FLAO|nr:alpha/beta hydrolase [Poritiphilus flavus]NAS12028.1 alpha/beta fold hydrolase [Poritiphilus flavus]
MNTLAQEHPEKEYLEINGVRLYCEIYGEGEPLMMLHGWTQSSLFWKDYVKSFADKFKVILVDLRGHGRSSPLTDDFSLELVKKDIIGLMDTLNLKTIQGIGLSYGSLALLKLAKDHPERIRSMILISAIHNYSGKDNFEENETFDFENLPPEFLEDLRKNHHHGEAQIRSLFDPDLNYEIRMSPEDLRNIPTKTLLINGEEDAVLPTEVVKQMHENLGKAESWIVPGQGHIPIKGKYEAEFLKRSLAFLNK